MWTSCVFLLHSVFSLTSSLRFTPGFCYWLPCLHLVSHCFSLYAQFLVSFVLCQILKVVPVFLPFTFFLSFFLWFVCTLFLNCLPCSPPSSFLCVCFVTFIKDYFLSLFCSTFQSTSAFRRPWQHQGQQDLDHERNAMIRLAFPDSQQCSHALHLLIRQMHFCASVIKMTNSYCLNSYLFKSPFWKMKFVHLGLHSTATKLI